MKIRKGQNQMEPVEQGIVPVVADVKPFCGLRKETTAMLTRSFRPIHHGVGDYLIRQGAEIVHVGFIESGEADLVVEDQRGNRILAGSAKSGDFFGVTVFAGGRISPLSLVCVQSCRCWVQDREAFLRLFTAHPKVREHFFLVALSQMSDALQALNGAAQRKGGRRKVRTPSQRKVEQALRYIEAHFAKPIRLADVAARIGMSKFHLSRTIKAETGRSFKEHLSRRRIEAAKTLLIRGESIASAAAKNGFRNPSYFTRVFSRMQGMTPTEYLKRLE